MVNKEQLAAQNILIDELRQLIVELQEKENAALLEAVAEVEEMQDKTKVANAGGTQPTITVMAEGLNTDEDIVAFINDGSTMLHKALPAMQATPKQWHIEHNAETTSAGIRPQYMMKKHQLQCREPSTRCMMRSLPPQLI